MEWKPACGLRERSYEFDVGGMTLIVSAMTWSNREQKHIYVEGETKWGAWFGASSAIAIDFPTMQAAQTAALYHAERYFRLRIASAKDAIAKIREAMV